MAEKTRRADLLDSSGRIPLGGASRCPLHAGVGQPVFLSFKLTAFILLAALNEHQGPVNRSMNSSGARPYHL